MTTAIGVTVYAYNRYQAVFMEVFQRYSGTLLAAESPDYQRISEDRHPGADTVVVLVQAIRG